jgi:hypothetical protein
MESYFDHGVNLWAKHILDFGLPVHEANREMYNNSISSNWCIYCVCVEAKASPPKRWKIISATTKFILT